MDRFWAWLRSGCGIFVFVQNMNVIVAGGDNSGRTQPSGRPSLRFLPAATPTPAVRPRLQVHLASHRRETLLERGNQEQIRAGWKAVIKGLEATPKGNR